MTNEEIKMCLARMAERKSSDVMNFDYAGMYLYICELERKNEELKEKLKQTFLTLHKYFIAKSDLGIMESNLSDYIKYELKEEINDE